MLSLRPKNQAELQAALGQMTAASKFIGGGTDYIIRLNQGVEHDYLCYLGYLDEYKGICEQDGQIIIGANTTMTEIENSPLIQEFLPALGQAAADLGSLQIRNNATIGGNIGNASPAGDLLPVLYLYQAVINTISPAGKAAKPITEIITAPGKTSLAHNEAIYQVTIKKPTFRTAFKKLGSRKKVTISRIGVAIGANLEGDIIKNAQIYIGAIAIKPICLSEAAQFIEGKPLNETNILGMAKILADYIYANTPKEFDRDYKVAAAKGVMSDVWQLIK